jgi:hypothetical protein
MQLLEDCRQKSEKLIFDKTCRKLKKRLLILLVLLRLALLDLSFRHPDLLRVGQ